MISLLEAHQVVVGIKIKVWHLESVYISKHASGYALEALEEWWFVIIAEWNGGQNVWLARSKIISRAVEGMVSGQA